MSRTLKHYVILICLFLFTFSLNTTALAKKLKTVTVIGEAEVVISGITPEEGWYKVKMRARADAIEKAEVEVFGSTLVEKGKLLADFIKATIRGYVVEEEIIDLDRWFEDTKPPIPHYKIKIKAKVVIPKKKPPQFEVLSLNKVIESEDKEKPIFIPTFEFLDKDKITVSIYAFEDIYVGIFLITEGDKILKLYPNKYAPVEKIKKGERKILPPPERCIFRVRLAKGHIQDTEALLIVSVPAKKEYAHIFDRFYKKEYEFTEFFEKYSEIADITSDDIVTYNKVVKVLKQSHKLLDHNFLFSCFHHRLLITISKPSCMSLYFRKINL